MILRARRSALHQQWHSSCRQLALVDSQNFALEHSGAPSGLCILQNSRRHILVPTHWPSPTHSSFPTPLAIKDNSFQSVCCQQVSCGHFATDQSHYNITGTCHFELFVDSACTRIAASVRHSRLPSTCQITQQSWQQPSILYHHPPLPASVTLTDSHWAETAISP